MAPLGIRNNNPGNLRPSPSPWKGTIGANGGFAVFDSMHHGLRALARQIVAYQDRYGINTVRGAISRWAPGNENNTEQYIAFVCHELNCQPDDRFDFHSVDFLFWIVTAIGEEENGHDAFLAAVSDSQIESAIADAIS